MDKLAIKKAIENIVSKRTSQDMSAGLSGNLSSIPGTQPNANVQQNLNNVSIPASGQQLFKTNALPTAEFMTFMAYPDPGKINQVISSTLNNLGFDKNQQYSPEETQRFVSAVQTSLKNLCGGFIQNINPQFFQGQI